MVFSSIIILPAKIIENNKIFYDRVELFLSCFKVNIHLYKQFLEFFKIFVEFKLSDGES